MGTLLRQPETRSGGPFGTRVQYPAGIFSVPEGKPEKGIGERLSTEDGRATLSVYSHPNESGDTPASYLSHYLRTPRTQLDYQRVTPAFFAISARRSEHGYGEGGHNG
jgi:hypothetical protein